MPRVNEMKSPGKFLGQQDVGTGVRLTIDGCSQHNTAKEGAPPVMKYCLEFRQTERPLVLNLTNMQILEKAFGSDNSDDWVGNDIILWADPNVTYGGKLVGGVRIRLPRNPAKPSPAPALPPEDPDDDIPFTTD